MWGLGGAIGWWLVPVSALSLIVALIRIHARLGLEDRTRVKRLEAFRTYLKDFSDLPNAPALAVIIWEHYLEWAVALDVADEVEKQVHALVPVESLRSPIRGAPTGLAGVTAWHQFQSAAPAIVGVSIASFEQRVLERRVRLAELVQRLLGWGVLRRRWRRRRGHGRRRGLTCGRARWQA